MVSIRKEKLWVEKNGSKIRAQVVTGTLSLMNTQRGKGVPVSHTSLEPRGHYIPQ